MCGITGFFSRKNIGSNTLRAMNDTMSDRGPDDSGMNLFCLGQDCAGLAQRRLSILDLSMAGHQPMFSADKKVCIVFNGEIYNYLALKQELIGYPFSSSCDTEVILAGYQRWGLDVFSHLNGMFAIAILDITKQELFLARDRIGEKPLFYFFDGSSFVFGSTLKPIMLFPDFPKRINTNVLSRYLYYHYICSPDTVFSNVFKVKPGEIVCYNGLEISKRVFWDIRESFKKGRASLITNYEDCKKQTIDLLVDSVSSRLLSDVPIGCFLSGGIDSTLVTAIASKVSPQKLNTYTIGFKDKGFDESRFASPIASVLGTNHHVMYFSESEMVNALSELVIAFDEPFADPSEIPTMMVCKLAKQDVTVALGGDGGDEFFCGYSSYDNARFCRFYSTVGFLARPFLFPFTRGDKYRQNQTLRRLNDYSENRREETKAQIRRSYPEKIVSEMLINPAVGLYFPVERSFETRSCLRRKMLLDAMTYLPDDIMCKADRSSMRYSLESRSPLLDYRLAELSFRIPEKFLFNREYGKKAILKDILYTYVPRQLIDRPKKGFGVPLKKWMNSFLLADIEALSSKNFLVNQGIFDYNGTKRIIDLFKATQSEEYMSVLWSFYVFQKWFSSYCG